MAPHWAPMTTPELWPQTVTDLNLGPSLVLALD